ncbi:unnamed protein product [Pieris macdunnoughi]|uniref:Uncharacterized protein n=1 Tax=Pieris macdunnoughi TaxID=345717 RepID=A0A821LWZ0_9NEOP|nr:unnamed protein product [Pieris macdunnoughi]
MFSLTTPREVTVVDGVQLIIDSPPASDPRNADGSAHMWHRRRRRFCVHVYFRYGRHAARFTVSLHNVLWWAGSHRLRRTVHPNPRKLQVGARS